MTKRRHSWAVIILTGILTGTMGISCLIPALSVNISAHLLKGEPWHAGAVFIVTVLLGSFVMIIRQIAKAHKASEIAFLCLIAGLACLSFNLKNAANSVTISREAFADPRKAQNEMIKRLENEANILTDILRGQRPRSSAVIAAEISGKLLDPAAEGCTGTAWNGPVTKEVCPIVANLRAEKAAAERFEKDQDRWREIQDQLNGLKGGAVSGDPQVENIAKVLGVVMTISETSLKYVALGNDLHTAIVIELVAMLGLPICWFAFSLAIRREEVEPDAVPVAAPVEDAQPEPVTVEEAAPAPEPKPSKTGKTKTAIPECVDRFFSEMVVKKTGGRLGASGFYAEYVDWCRAEGIDPVSPQKFGRCATATFKKAEGATNAYIGIGIRQKTAKLKVVK